MSDQSETEVQHMWFNPYRWMLWLDERPVSWLVIAALGILSLAATVPLGYQPQASQIVITAVGTVIGVGHWLRARVKK